MDWKKWWARWSGTASQEEEPEKKKDWFRILFPIILAAAVIFLLLPTTHISKNDKTGTQTSETDGEAETSGSGTALQNSLAAQLEDAFSHMQGVGRTKVVILFVDSGETSVLQNENYVRSFTEEEDGSGGKRRVEEEEKKTDAVLDGNEQPYVIRETTPRVQGILILAEGASSAVVREQLIAAARALLEIPVTNIHVAPYQE